MLPKRAGLTPDFREVEGNPNRGCVIAKGNPNCGQTRKPTLEVGFLYFK